MHMNSRSWGMVIAVGLGGTSLAAYWLIGRPSQVERDLTSGDSTRVVAALAAMDTSAFDADENAALRSQALLSLKKTPVDQLMDRMRNPQLSEEERTRLRENLWALMREDMEQKVSACLDAPADRQQAILDEHIDEMLEFTSAMRAYHEKHKNDPDYQAEQARSRDAWRPPSRQDRKAQMEGTNPDQMARMFQYWSKMYARTSERGIDFGRGAGSNAGK